MFKSSIKFVLAAIVVAVAACEEPLIVDPNGSDDDDSTLVDSIFNEYDKESLEQTIFAEASSIEFTFAAIHSCTISCDADWLTVDPLSTEVAGGAIITMSASLNHTGADRKAAVTIQSDSVDVSIVVHITQSKLTSEGEDPMATDATVTNVANEDGMTPTLAESLVNTFGVDYASEISSIKVLGSMNAADFVALHTFEEIDLREVDVVGPITVYPGFPQIENAIPFVAFMDMSAGTPVPVNTIKKLYLPDEVVEIGAYGIAALTKLEVLHLPKSLKIVWPYAASKNGMLQTITNWGVVKEIREWAFDGCIMLEKLELPSTLKVLEGHAFGECIALTHVILPDGFERMVGPAFVGCENLQSIHIPAGADLSEASQAFQRCKSLESIALNSTLDTIPLNLATSSGLKSLDIPESVKELKRVAYSDGYETINYPFTDCKDMTSITVHWTQNIPEIQGLHHINSEPNDNDRYASMSWIDSGAHIGTFSEQFARDGGEYAITIPKGTTALYEAVKGWNTYALKEAE